MPSILFVVPHRSNRAPSQRFRFEQYIRIWQQAGYRCTMAPLISEHTDTIFYHPSSLFRKALLFANLLFIRLKHVIQSSAYDIVFIQREAFMTGTTFFEKQFKRSGAKIIYDFDDAIWHHDVSEANKKFALLKRPQKTAQIIAMSDLVIAGNYYLKQYALQYNQQVLIIPTTIDTNNYIKKAVPRTKSGICIGWSGSVTTIKHFILAVPVLERLKKHCGHNIYFKVIGDDTYLNEALEIQGIKWNEATEIDDLSEIDIGIKPLPNDEWSKGKCGLKGLQYMALEIPTVMAAVGVNTEIIVEGVNGYLAEDENMWFEKILALINQPQLRQKMGKAARQTVIEKYSIHSQQQNYLNCTTQILSS
ncbi:MAG TPA: glycosyltransferase family 4 protein [Bacteroidia bacterium]|nr:glycosyltransferase family 4 protein [Bacteroidia bacterium]